MAVSGYKLARHYWMLHQSKKKDDAVKEIAQASAEPNERWTPGVDTYKTMHDLNSDYVGWILWDSDIISEPIVQGETNNAYLRHNFNREYDVFGSIFMDSNNKLTDDNLMIYGHSLAGDKAAKQMFSPLQNITNQAFLDANSSFKIYWEDHISSYEIISAMLMDQKQRKMTNLLRCKHATTAGRQTDISSSPEKLPKCIIRRQKVQLRQQSNKCFRI